MDLTQLKAPFTEHGLPNYKVLHKYWPQMKYDIMGMVQKFYERDLVSSKLTRRTLCSYQIIKANIVMVPNVDLRNFYDDML
jgi:septum formation topological specificity factor MinE